MKKTMDMRNISEKDQYVRILDTLNNLKSGEEISLITDQSPETIKTQISDTLPNMFQWNYVEDGTRDWKVNVRKVSNISRGQAIENAMPTNDEGGFDPLNPIH